MMTFPTSIRSIVVATDLTPQSEAAVRSAADLAIAASARLHVVHACEEPRRNSAEGRELLAMQKLIHDRRVRMHDILDTLLPSGLNLASSRVHVGNAAEVIAEEAANVDADLVVLGAHKDRGIADRYLGSTAERLLTRLRMPCLLANGPLPLPVRSILVPTDGSAASRAAIFAAFAAARVVCTDGGGSVTLTHVLDPAMDPSSTAWSQQDVIRELQGPAREALASTGGNLTYDVAVLPGEDAGEALVRHAQDVKADLIVMGTHCDRVLVRALLNSVSSYLVRRATVPVLLIPTVVTAATSDAEETEDSLPITANLPI
jgi:universal stress protein E